MEDQKIVALIKESRNSKAFQELYQNFPMIRKMIITRGGKKEDAEDVFQEALIILCRKVKESNFVLTSKLSTFLYSICLLIWKDELKKRQKMGFVEFNTELDRIDEDGLMEAILKENDHKVAESIVAELGDRCKELLMMFYQGAMKLKMIADKMGYNSEATAKNQKYKCLEAAKNRLKELKSKSSGD